MTARRRRYFRRLYVVRMVAGLSLAIGSLVSTPIIAVAVDQAPTTLHRWPPTGLDKQAGAPDRIGRPAVAWLPEVKQWSS